MKVLLSLALGVAMAGMTIFAEADARPRPVGGVRVPPPAPPTLGNFPGFIVVEREVPVIVEMEAPVVTPVVVAPPVPPPPPRKAYAVGASYASLPPQGCMKLIEEGASFYYCGGREWYRQIGEGRRARFKAVARP